MILDLRFEREGGYPDHLVAGVDEVGRGCLAGPVVAASVTLPTDFQTDQHEWLKDVTDSKLVKKDLRIQLASQIREVAEEATIGVANEKEIEELNIFHASHLAMVRAVKIMIKPPKHVLVDGKHVPKDLRIPTTALIKGDLQCLSIACASIVAKVWRDQYMEKLDEFYPGYGFSNHKGYPTQEHLDSLKKLGVSRIHRTKFGPVSEVLEEEI